MPKNWFISCHGYTDKQSGGRFAITTRQTYDNFTIPTGVELVTYTEQGVNLSMQDGWDLWDLLISNQEALAYARKHKAKKWPTAIINYGLSGPHDAADYQAWVSNQGKIAIGLFEVGKDETWYGFPIGTQVTTLKQVLLWAKAARVARVYYLACQALG